MDEIGCSKRDLRCQVSGDQCRAFCDSACGVYCLCWCSVRWNTLHCYSLHASGLQFSWRSFVGPWGLDAWLGTGKSLDDVISRFHRDATALTQGKEQDPQ